MVPLNSPLYSNLLWAPLHSANPFIIASVGIFNIKDVHIVARALSILCLPVVFNVTSNKFSPSLQTVNVAQPLLLKEILVAVTSPLVKP